MDRLSTLRTGRDIKQALKDIPSTLHETYAAMLDRIPDWDREIAREALMWLCFSLRPLYLDELSEAVILREDDISLDSDCRLNNPDVILEICQGLIYSSDDEVTLAHDSIRSFLLSDWIRTSKAAYFAMDPAECHRRITRKCLAYLSFDKFAAGPIDTQWQLIGRFALFPLLKYASELWPIHSERFPLEAEDEAAILSFFNTSNSGSFGSWVQCLLDTTDLDAIRNTEPLYYAASYNMVSILKILLRPGSNVDVNKRGGRYQSPPLFVAVWRGNREAVEILLEAGADAHAKDSGSDINSIQLAHRMGTYGSFEKIGS
jgi:hypothetical protein